MIELDQVVARALLAGEALQRTNPQPRDPVRRRNDAHLRMCADPVGNHCAAIRNQQPFPVGIGLGEQRLESVVNERRTMGRSEYAESHMP